MKFQITHAALMVALFVTGCTTLSVPPDPSISAPATATPSPSAARASAPATPTAVTASAPAASAAGASAGPPLRPFADFIKDAKKIEGLFTLYEKDDKVYLELSPEQLGNLYFLQLNINRGLPDERALSARTF